MMASNEKRMVARKSWEEFRSSGLFWWMNMILHTFGWAICARVDDETKEVTEAFPAKVKYRGFADSANDEGYAAVTRYMSENASALEAEIEE